MDELYEFQHVVKTYGEGERKLVILNGVSITVHRGEQLAIVGASGSGKSTLLHLMGALDTPTSGKVIFDGQDLFSLTPDEQARICFSVPPSSSGIHGRGKRRHARHHCRPVPG